MEKLLRGIWFLSPGGNWVGGEGQERVGPLPGRAEGYS